jgi:hypothetical protein
MKWLDLIACLAALACCGGCERSASYTMTVKNGTSEDLNDVRIAFGTYSDIVGSMSAGVDKSEGLVTADVTDQGNIRWRTPDEVLHDKTVQLRPAVPPDFREGVLMVEILSTSDIRVSVHPSVVVPHEYVPSTPSAAVPSR